MATIRGRALSPTDDHARTHSPLSGREHAEQPSLSVEELCTCGHHRSPNNRMMMRKPLPFKGSSENHDQYKSFSVEESRGAIRNPIISDKSKNKLLFNGQDDVSRFESTQRSDYTAKYNDINVNNQKIEMRMRKPLPFKGSSEVHESYKWDASAARDALRTPMNKDIYQKSTLKLFDSNTSNFDTTMRSDYNQKELPRGPDGGKSSTEMRMRKPLPFKGESEMHSQYPAWSNEERRDALRNQKDDLKSRLRNGNFKVVGGTEGSFYTTMRTDYPQHQECPAGKLLRECDHPDSLPQGRNRMYFDEQDRVFC